MNKIDELIIKLRGLEQQANFIQEKIDKLREKIKEELANSGQDFYKNDLATISIIAKKTVKYKSEDALEYLKFLELKDFIEVVPEHEEISKTFDEAIKNGDMQTPEFVEIITKDQLVIRLK